MWKLGNDAIGRRPRGGARIMMKGKPLRLKTWRYGSFRISGYRVELVKTPTDIGPKIRLMEGKTEVASYGLADALQSGFAQVVSAHVPGINGILLGKKVLSLAQRRGLVPRLPTPKLPRGII